MQWECEYRSCKVRGNTEVSHHVAEAVQARPHQDGKSEILMHLSIEIMIFMCDTCVILNLGPILLAKPPKNGMEKPCNTVLTATR